MFTKGGLPAAVKVQNEIETKGEETMQAIVETLFDAAYLVSVMTIGILMIRGSREECQF